MAKKSTKAAARNAKRTATNKAKAARVTKATAPTVKGFPNVPIITGKGTGDNTIAAIIPVNRNNDDAALLNDGSVHICSKHMRAGITVKSGMNWDTVNKDFLAMARKEKEAAPAAAALARGVEGKFTEHSRKAASDSKRSAKETKMTKTTKETKKTARKAERAAKAAPKADDTRRISILDKKFTFGGEGTARRASWDFATAVAKAKGTAADYIAKGGKAKYLPRWVAAGAIKLA